MQDQIYGGVPPLRSTPSFLLMPMPRRAKKAYPARCSVYVDDKCGREVFCHWSFPASLIYALIESRCPVDFMLLPSRSTSAGPPVVLVTRMVKILVVPAAPRMNLWLANCCFAHISLGFLFLLRSCDEQSGQRRPRPQI
jgi:hypothetical protein